MSRLEEIQIMAQQFYDANGKISIAYMQRKYQISFQLAKKIMESLHD